MTVDSDSAAVGAKRAGTVARHRLRLLQLPLTIGLLWLVLRRVELAELVSLFSRSLDRWPLLLIALALPALGLLIASLRWRVLLGHQGVEPPLRVLYSALLVGSFFNHFFPSTIGGDVVRSWWLSRPVGSKLLSLTVVGVDRLVGLTGIVAIAVLAALLAPEVAAQIRGLWAFIAAVVAAGGAAFLLARRSVRAPRRGSVSTGRMGAVRQRAAEVLETVASYRDQPWRLLTAFALSMALQLAIVIQYIVVALAAEINVSPWAVAIVIPIVTLVALVPVTINGIGLRENALAILGASIGIEATDAVAMAWFVTAIAVIYACMGGLTHLIGRRPGPDSNRR